MLLLKHLHITCVILTGISFFSRGLLRFYWPSVLDQRWIRITPHLIDTLLLISAIGLAKYWLHAQQPWLIAKIFALIGYILLGHRALNRQLAAKDSALAFAGALLIFFYMVSVAHSKSIYGPLTLLMS